MNEQLANQLTQIGLHEREAKAYLALLELGESGVSAISKKSGIQRTYVYDVLGALVERGLALEYEKGGKKTYQAQGPETIEAMLQQRLTQFGDILPALLSLNNMAPHKPKIRYFEGSEALDFIRQQIEAGLVDIVVLMEQSRALQSLLPLEGLKLVHREDESTETQRATVFIGLQSVTFLSMVEKSPQIVSIEDKVIASTLLAMTGTS
jgi:sugar-specific transcriptional regulator TrmB